jgi:hypothetical protein
MYFSHPTVVSTPRGHGVNACSGAGILRRIPIPDGNAAYKNSR